MTIIYDNKFDLNEWLVIVSLIVGIILVWVLRYRFPIKQLLVYCLLGVFTGLVIDHTISIPPFDFYDVNDNSSYEFMDFLTYLTFGVYSYMYIYVYDYLKIKPSRTPIYILLWALLSFTIEYLGHLSGIYHYKNGYRIFYSFPIYLLVLSLFIWLYKGVRHQKG